MTLLNLLLVSAALLTALALRPWRQLAGGALLSPLLAALVITPWLWIFSLVTFLVFALLAAISVLGILFILPLWSVISCVAYRLAHEFAANLRLAREELGERKPIRSYRKRAEDLCLIQEMQKPVRTWRDVFKPWDY